MNASHVKALRRDGAKLAAAGKIRQMRASIPAARQRLPVNETRVPVEGVTGKERAKRADRTLKRVTGRR